MLIINSISSKIQGVVKDENTKEPIPYADVIILNTEIGTATDEDGNFYILNVPPGRYTVEVSCVGYQAKQIKDVIVEINQTARLKVNIKQALIEISPITVIYETPVVKKDMTGTTYIIRKTDIAHLPIDYTIDLVAFQAAVARLDTALHVRGGRATEVQYMIDNVSIIDPQTGDPAINISKGVIDEVIFLPGGFDAEYGRAMSGVINIITEYPTDYLSTEIFGKSERIMPYYYDFGYENYQSSVHLPISKKSKGVLSLDIMHTDDWNPKLFIQPHKQRDDYALYGKWLFAPSSKLTLTLSGAKSRSQFERTHTRYIMILDHYLSNMRKGDLQILDIHYLPDTRKLFNVTLSRLYTNRIYGVKEPGFYGVFEDYAFRDYHTLEWIHGGFDNPFGVFHNHYFCRGDYPEYQDKSSQILKANFNTTLQVHKYHELKTGAEYAYQTFNNFTYFVSNNYNLQDRHQHHPTEFSAFLQDNIDYEGLYVKIGCRYDCFSSDIQGIEPKSIISPRLGFSFMVTEKFLFRANVGRYTQPPLYEYMYNYYNLLPLPSYIGWGLPDLLVGNPDLESEKTVSYEIGLQGEIRQNITATVNTFYKDVTDLVGTRFIAAMPLCYMQYFNVEYTNIKGVETILEFSDRLFSGKISYTLSWAQGTSSYANEVYERYYRKNPDTSFIPPQIKYYLDFDQRHRIFLQGTANLPLQTEFHVFGYIGNGFPYTPPGPEGKYEERNILRFPFQKQIDCVISKTFTLGKVSLIASAEIINLLDERNQIQSYLEGIPYEFIPRRDDYMTCLQSNYRPAADQNHDGLITPFEEFMSYVDLYEYAVEYEWIRAYTAPRRARIGVSISFQ